MLKLIPLVTALLVTSVSSNSANAQHVSDPNCKPRLPRDGKCWKDILGLEWTVHGFDSHASYTFTNPAHQNSWGYVNFNLTNNVVPYTAVCDAASSQLTDFFYGTVEYSCTLPATAPAGSAIKFRFSRPSGKLDIVESIVCSEKKTTNSGTFVVSGSTALTLACTDTTTVTPDWKPGQIYSQRDVKCTPVTITFPPTQVVG